MTALLERLGHPPDARLLIVSADGLGVSNAANMGVFAGLRLGVASSTGLMMPCPWSRHAAARVDVGDDVGVALTLNAEHEQYRWGPLTQAPTLLDGDGGFPRTVADVWDHADVDEVRRECRAQLERARQWGVEVTHLSSHLHALLLRPEFFDVLLELAVEAGLPIRLAPDTRERLAGFPLRRLADEEGVLHPDHVVAPRNGAQLVEALRSLPAGVTEVVLRPALDSPELRAYTADWASQVEDYDLLVNDAHVISLLRDVTCIGYAELRRAQQPVPVVD
jgi:chitin disaccharide deacetylase